MKKEIITIRTTVEKATVVVGNESSNSVKASFYDWFLLSMFWILVLDTKFAQRNEV